MAEYKFVNTEQLEADLGKVGSAIRSKGGTTELLAFPEEMVSAIGAISTGVELNFDVVPGLTQPGTAAENTIWVKTASLTGWYFAATQPENMQEGEVWFPTGTESAVKFNALKKNSLQVYPLSVKQMIGGVLVDVEAMSYQGGEWHDWKQFFYRQGDEFESITGGWTGNGFFVNGASSFEATKEDDRILIQGNANSECAVIATAQKINLAQIDTLYFDCEVINAVNNVSISVGANDTKLIGYAGVYIELGGTLGRRIVSVDVSQINTDCYVFGASGSSNKCAAYLYEVWGG